MAITKKEKHNTGGFVPDDYSPPSSGGYTKLEQGDNRMRIVSNALPLWKVWEDGKVTRTKYAADDKPEKPTTTENDSVQHVLAVVAYNYQTQAIEVWEIDKASVRGDLMALINNPDWGHPRDYDIIVNKKGTTKNDTKYKTMPCPKKEASDEIIDAFTATPINLNNLLENKDPFMGTAGAAADTKATTSTTKVVTKDNWAPGDAIPAGFKEKDGKLVEKKLPWA